MKNIVYFHGLSSSGNSRTGRILRELFPNVNVITPDIPVSPAEAVSFLKQLLSNLDKSDTIVVGTSMGGMYAQQMTGYKRILVNPAFHVSNTLKKHQGKKLPFFSDRTDGAKEFDVTEELINDFIEMEKHQFDGAGDTDNVYALFGTNDEIVDCKQEYLQHYSNYQYFDGEHRLDDETIRNVLYPLITNTLG